MHKAAEWVWGLLKNMLIVGLGVQVLLGLGWLVCSFGRLPQFEESRSGVLYPLLVEVTRGFESVFRIPYYCILSVLQLGCAAAAAYYGLLLLRGGRNMRRNRLGALRGSLVLLTVPMVLQCHLAPLPYSLASSGLFLEIALVWKLLQKKEPVAGKELLAPLLCWGGCVLLLPEYGVLGAVPLLLVLAVVVTRCLRKKSACSPGGAYRGALLLTAGGLMVAAGICQANASPLVVTICSRISWSSISGYYEDWPEEAINVISYEEVLSVASNPENVERELWPAFREQFGDGKAEELLREINQLTWERSKSRVLRQAAWDVMGHAFSPYVVQQQLKGNAYASYTGRNYDIMRWYAPRLTELYVDYSCWMFVVGLLLAALLQLRRIKNLLRSKGLLIVLAGLSGGGMVLWYAMQGGGIMDYKQSITVLLLWYTWMICRTLQSEREVNQDFNRE